MQRKAPKPDNMPDLNTITPSERKAFEQAFEEIAARSAPRQDPESSSSIYTPNVDTASNPDVDTPWSPLSALSFPATTLDPDGPERRDDGRMRLHDIMSDAAEKYNKNAPIRGLGTLQSLKSANDRVKELMRLHPGLREVASKTLGIRDGEEPEAQDQNQTLDSQSAESSMRSAEMNGPESGFRAPLPTLNALAGNDDLNIELREKRLRRDERKSITMEMEACRTDFELWQVIEAKIFTLPDRLGLSTNRPPGYEPTWKVPMPQLYSVLYPQLLITSLEYLETQFDQPSQLVLAVLPRMKELGDASYVMGISTAFYNRLIDIYWRRYGDVGSVLAHLEEMRHMGMYLDNETFATVSQMTAWLTEMANGEHGDFQRAVMGMPDYEVALRSRLKHWTKQIARSIVERKDALGY